MVPVDTNGVKVLYGVNSRKGMRLHDFYHTMSNAVVCRDETTDTMGIPFCGSCGQQHSGATLESCWGRCTYCVCCPPWATLLLAKETEHVRVSELQVLCDRLDRRRQGTIPAHLLLAGGVLWQVNHGLWHSSL
ncbi:hypothetical protein DIPPA_16390 [Diplonema papillatum]|nr:hypothetical protein DIPPA_16390 [Diplonema papillatum]